MKLIVCVALVMLLSLVCAAAFGQDSRSHVVGKVVQSDSLAPAEGASIININTQLGTIADHNGMFLLKASPGDSVLVRSIGFKSVVYHVTASDLKGKAIDFLLQEESVTLQEVEIKGLPSLEQLKRNYGRKPADQSQVKNPAFRPSPENAAVPEGKVTVGSPVSMLYNVFSKEAKELQKLEEFEEKQRQEQARKEQQKYNSFFLNNEGYEQ